MHIVVDANIPYIRGHIEAFGEVLYKKGSEITAEDVRDADVLVIRTRTRCDGSLLKGAKVKFIVTATIGFDHLDLQFLQDAGIQWVNCPGCNATSVAQYVESALLLLAIQRGWKGFASATLGIVGVGHVGTAVFHMAQKLNFGRILLCDPPRVYAEGLSLSSELPLRGVAWTSLSTLAHESDILTFHTPLSFAPSPWPTFQMVDAHFLSSLKSGAIVINSSRGEVVCTQALVEALDADKGLTAIIDTWESEPNISRALLSRVFLGTPHIAGYSADGKANATRMALAAVAHFLGKPCFDFEKIQPPALPEGYKYFSGPSTFCESQGRATEVGEEALHCQVAGLPTWVLESLRLYNPMRDYLALRECPQNFELLRANYPLRREHA